MRLLVLIRDLFETELAPYPAAKLLCAGAPVRQYPTPLTYQQEALRRFDANWEKLRRIA